MQTEEKEEKSKRKRALHLITGVEHGGGAENMLLKTLPYLEKTENAVCAMTGHGQKGKELEEAGVKVYYLGMKSKLDIRGIFRYRKVLKTYQPDLQVNYLIHADMFGRVFGKLFRVPKMVVYIRNRHTSKQAKVFEKLTLWSIDFLLANSEANLEYYRKTYGLSESKSLCIPNGVVLRELPTLEERREVRDTLNLSQEIPVIVSTSRLVPQKDIDTFIQAMQILKRKNVPFQTLILNDGSERKRLEKLCNELGISEDVYFLGKRKDVSEILKASDIFILPSKKEGMSNALLEAMATPLACVVSAIPENVELIENRKNGLIFPVGNSEECAEVLEGLLKSQETRDECKSKAQKTVEEKYDIVKIRRELDEFFYE